VTLLAAAAGWLLCCAAFAAGLPILPVAPLAAGVAVALPARRLRDRWLHVGIAVVVVAAGAALLHRAGPSLNSAARFADESVTLVGRATADADSHPSYSTVTLDALTVQDTDGRVAAAGRVLVDLPAVTDLPDGTVRAGDVLQLQGVLQSRADAAGDGGYASYLERQGIVAALAYPRLTLLSRPRADPLHRLLRATRQRLQAGLTAVLPPREAALGSALLFGNRHALPRDLNADLLTDGATHAVSFTAFNVLLLYGAVLGVLAPLLGRRRGALLALGAAGLYGALGGTGPSALRGEAVALVLTLATLSGRPYSPAAMLALVAAAMALRDPTLIGDTGLQLTFAAAAGVAVVAPRLGALLDGDGERAAHGLRQALVFGLGVSLAVAPVAALTGGAGLLSPIANVLLYPLLAPLMALAALAGTLAAIWQPLAWPVAALLWLGLRGFAIVAHACAIAPGAALALKGSGPGLAIGWYAALAAAGVLAPRLARLLLRGRPRSMSRRSRVRRRWMAPLTAAGAFVMLLSSQPAYAALRPPPRPVVTVRWLAAGSRPAALIEGGGVRVLLCSASEPAALAQAVEAATGDGGGVDVLVVGPGSLSAAGAAATMLDAGELIGPAVASDSASSAYGAFPATLLLNGSATVPLGGSGSLTVLAGSRYEAVQIGAGGRSVLLVQDARDPAGLSAAATAAFDTVALPPLEGSGLQRALPDFPGSTLLLAGAWSAADATIARHGWPGRVADALPGAALELWESGVVLRAR
jgi:ComEC/Rec2-related protein